MLAPSKRTLISLGAALAVVASAPSAHAYCRTMTQPAPPDFDPSTGGCWNTGKPVYWANACAGFSVQKADGKKLKAADLASLLAQAFSVWTSASCTAGGRPSIDIKQLDSTTVDAVEYKTGGPNVNLVVMRDDNWPHAAGGETLALTTLSFQAETGEIFDADIEINTAENNFAIADPVADDAMDLRVVLAHQAGHFLGFAHSADPKSPMNAAYTPGSPNRTLLPDDVAGMCDVYAPGGARKTGAGTVNAAACDPTPRGGLEVAPPPASAKGCATAPGSPASAGVLGGLAALALSAVRRRRR
jgi:MYXO-CTERM domain-containing protein